MKIIAHDNFDRDEVAEFLVAENIQNEEMAKVMAGALNNKYCNHDDAPYYYHVVKDDHKLWRGMAELV